MYPRSVLPKTWSAIVDVFTGKINEVVNRPLGKSSPIYYRSDALRNEMQEGTHAGHEYTRPMCLWKCQPSPWLMMCGQSRWNCIAKVILRPKSFTFSLESSLR